MSHSSVTLYCFAHAGGSATSYARWKRGLPAGLKLEPVELPGHGSRIAEPLENRIPRIVESIYVELQPRLQPPYALFGHSMGSVVAFELAHRLREAGGPEPLVLFASGADAPSRRDNERYARLTSDQDLVQELARLDGTPEAALANASLREFALPILRADFQACGSYVCPAERSIGSPIHVLGGMRDTTTPETLAAWAEHTTGEVALDMFSGGHFFIREHETALLTLIASRIGSLLDCESRAASPARATPAMSRGARANGEGIC